MPDFIPEIVRHPIEFSFLKFFYGLHFNHVYLFLCKTIGLSSLLGTNSKVTLTIFKQFYLLQNAIF